MSNINVPAVRSVEDRTNNFRSNAIETLRWYCSEKKPHEITSALQELFASSRNCTLMRCELIFLGGDAVSETAQAEENDLQYLSATKMPFYSEFSNDVSSLVQFCINGSSFEGGNWQVRIQLSVKADSELVWETILSDICSLPDGYSNQENELPGASADAIADSSVFPDDEVELGYQTMTSELVNVLRIPLGMITSRIRRLMAKKDAPLNSDDRKLLANIESETDSVDRMLEQFAGLMEPVEPNLARVNLIDLLRDVAESSTYLDGSFSDIVESCYPREADNLIVEADPHLFRRAFGFLLQQLPSSVPGCEGVAVQLRTEDDSIILQFEYGGGRIRPDLLRKVVLPFEYTKDGGSGLANVPVHRIVSAHAGKTFISSSETTTVITITLPLCEK